MRLFHFSDDPGITVFNPRPVRVPVDRPAGQDWLNGPLVWAIDEAHQRLYLFPRECPRILVWKTPETNEADTAEWFGNSAARAMAFVESRWLERLETASIHRYEMPLTEFEDIGDVGMWVSRRAVHPMGVDRLTSLTNELDRRGVELRVVDTLLALKGVWRTSLHASGIRLRNAKGWDG